MKTITVKTTNNAYDTPQVNERVYADLLAAHLAAEKINNWPRGQYRGTSAVVLVDGVVQMSRQDQWYRDDAQARRCDIDLPAMDDTYQPRVIADVDGEDKR